MDQHTRKHESQDTVRHIPPVQQDTVSGQTGPTAPRGNQTTVRSPRVSVPTEQRIQHPAPPHPVPAPPPVKPAARRKRTRNNWRKAALTVGVGAALALGVLLVVGVSTVAVMMPGSNEILPGVQVAGIELGGMTESEAANRLEQFWELDLALSTGQQSIAVDPDRSGISLDAAATARNARNWGSLGDEIMSVFRAREAQIEPVLNVDLVQFQTYLESIQPVVDHAPVNAGVRLVNGQAVATEGIPGQTLDIAATVDRMRVDAAGELADGSLDLVMVDTPPAITDATPLVDEANRLLSSPFSLRAYDPIRDEWSEWSAPPETWSAWLQAESAPDSPTGLALTLNPDAARNYVQSIATFADERYIKPDDVVDAAQAALEGNSTAAEVRVWHNETSYTVRGGQTLAAIGEEVGIPYPYIQAANPGINPDALSAGQVLSLPSRDLLVPLEPVPHKRIIIYRGQQRLEAYDSGQLVFNWVISTGIATSPTALGIFQVQSHDINAYAEQWQLYMPHFIGFYHPGPNTAVMNGFHGFPTRGGGYLLWVNDLGRPATYGCVLLNLENAETLYTWAEEGVIVEVRAG
ncbi:MAG: L,D-transpeptidase family protein [Chloroflexi bacterium]|nr:L,D-transpeptidase family protein [Chloroflexota bacterium]